MAFEVVFANGYNWPDAGDKFGVDRSNYLISSSIRLPAPSIVEIIAGIGIFGKGRINKLQEYLWERVFVMPILLYSATIRSLRVY